MNGEMVPAGPVFEGELVDDQLGATQPPQAHRVAFWWQRLRFVPAALKSRQALGYTAKDGSCG